MNDRTTVRTAEDFAAWAAAHARGLTFAGPDPHYAIGLEGLVPGYRIASVHPAPALDILRAQGIAVFTLAPAPGAHAFDTDDRAGVGPRDTVPGFAAAPGAAGAATADAERNTADLLADPGAAAFVDGASGRGGPPGIIVFKTSHAIERICRQRGWPLVCAPAAVSRRWENKLTFRALADSLGLRQPPGLGLDLVGATYAAVSARLGPRFVLQAAHGFSGARTYPVADAAAFEAAARALRAPAVRASAFLEGSPLTLNACVTARGVAAGAPFVQITGDPRLTRYPLGACGNDWVAGAAMDLDPAPFVDIARRVGEALAAEGYRGIFGLDFVREPDGRLAVIEVNPRLVASIALHAQLELAAGRLPLLARHVLAFLDPGADAAPLDLHLAPVAGAQVILHHVAGDAPRDVAGAVATGVHRLAPGAAQLVPVRPAVRVDALEGPDEMLVLAPAAGRRIHPGQAWGRIQLGRRAVDGAGALLPDVAAAVAALGRAAGLA